MTSKELTTQLFEITADLKRENFNGCFDEEINQITKELKQIKKDNYLLYSLLKNLCENVKRGK